MKKVWKIRVILDGQRMETNALFSAKIDRQMGYLR